MRLYLAGPMRGIPYWNHPAFDAGAEKLRAFGHEVFNPAEHDRSQGLQPDPDGLVPKEADIRKLLLADFTWICEHAEGIALLDNWERSAGVKAEIAIAEAIGIPVDRYMEWCW